MNYSTQAVLTATCLSRLSSDCLCVCACACLSVCVSLCVCVCVCVNVANVDKLHTTVDSLGEQMSTLIQWQHAEVNPAIVKSKETAALVESFMKCVEALENSRFTRSAFEEWVDAEFATVKDAANAVLPRSEFKSFLMEEEETRARSPH